MIASILLKHFGSTQEQHQMLQLPRNHSFSEILHGTIQLRGFALMHLDESHNRLEPEWRRPRYNREGCCMRPACGSVLSTKTSQLLFKVGCGVLSLRYHDVMLVLIHLAKCLRPPKCRKHTASLRPSTHFSPKGPSFRSVSPLLRLFHVLELLGHLLNARGKSRCLTDGSTGRGEGMPRTTDRLGST